MSLNKNPQNTFRNKIQYILCRRSNVARASSFAVKIVKLADHISTWKRRCFYIILSHIPNVCFRTLLTSSFFITHLVAIALISPTN